MVKNILLRIISAFLGLLFAAVFPGTARGDAAAGGLSGPDRHVSRLERKIHEAVNGERARNDLLPLLWNERLHLMARRHSEDMARRNYFSHDEPGGRDFSRRFDPSLFECRIRGGVTICKGAENLSRIDLGGKSPFFDNGRLLLDDDEEGRLAERVVRGWMGSHDHRENILTTFFRRQGIGVAVSRDGTIYITEDF